MERTYQILGVPRACPTPQGRSQGKVARMGGEGSKSKCIDKATELKYMRNS
jgi:hypothetical protein